MISTLVSSAAAELDRSVEFLVSPKPDRSRAYVHARMAATHLIQAYRLVLPHLMRGRASRRLDLAAASLWLAWRELVDMLCDWPRIPAQRLEELSGQVREMLQGKSDRLAA